MNRIQVLEGKGIEIRNENPEPKGLEKKKVKKGKRN